MSETEEKLITFEEVSKHSASDDLWIVYNGFVYDCTSYLDEHPGGEEVLVDVAGTDATDAFDDIGHSEDAHEILVGLKIGRLEGGVVKKTALASSTASSEGGLPLPLIAALVVAVAAGAYFFLNN